jgi:hypothetical protein
MGRKPGVHGASFKAKVALAAARGDKTQGEQRGSWSPGFSLQVNRASERPGFLKKPGFSALLPFRSGSQAPLENTPAGVPARGTRSSLRVDPFALAPLPGCGIPRIECRRCAGATAG